MERPSPVTRHPSRLWTVVPVRGIAAGKSRLGAVLDPRARAQLNRWLLGHTLDAIVLWRGSLDCCVVVSSCGEARAIAATRGAVVVEEGREAVGINPAAALGAEHARNLGALRVLVLPCDLPCLAPAALAALEEAAAQAPLVIAPDRAGSGTNALLASLEVPFESRFGADSRARHAALARERGWRAAIVARSELEFDLDTPADLAAWKHWPDIAPTLDGQVI